MTSWTPIISSEKILRWEQGRHVSMTHEYGPLGQITRWHSQPVLNTTEKCYDHNDKTLAFVEGEDEMDFLCMGYKSLRARMSCGHTVTPMSLFDWCQQQLEEGSTKFTCGQTNCNAEWSYEEVRKMALLTPAETKSFEDKLYRNAKNSLNVKSCPGCRCLVVRDDPNNLCVQCPKCTASNNNNPYKFCWQCLQAWKGAVPASDHCENEDCCNVQLSILKNCPVIHFKDVQMVRGCPCIRACPSCGKLLEHSRLKCKFLICKRCKANFCFVCLKLFPECQNHYELCLSGLTPRQTSIPVWDGKTVNTNEE